MNLPTKIKIGPMMYEVTEMEDAMSGDEKVWGATDATRCEIIIERNLSEQSKIVTFWHEIIHVILFQMGLDEHDEGFVNGLAHHIYGVLRENRSDIGR